MYATIQTMNTAIKTPLWIQSGTVWSIVGAVAVAGVVGWVYWYAQSVLSGDELAARNLTACEQQYVRESLSKGNAVARKSLANYTELCAQAQAVQK